MADARRFDEHDALAASARSLLAQHAGMAAVRAAAASALGHDPGLWQRMCDQLGMAALAIPERYDGAGFSLFESLVVLEEIGRSLAPSPLLATLLAAEVLLATDDSPAKERLLPRCAAGEIATVAWSGITSPGRSEPVVFDGRVLHGSASDVLFGDQAQVLLVAARTAEGIALLEVDPANVQRTWTPAMDTTLRLARLTFDGTPASIFTADARPALRRVQVVGTAAVAALQVGCAALALDRTVAYTRTRVQFGRPIGSFQALKHRMADLLVLRELSCAAARTAARAAADHSDDAERLSTIAAAYCGEALQQIAAETVQLHGGMAISWEHDAQLIFKRAHALNVLFGAPQVHRAALLPSQ